MNKEQRPIKVMIAKPGLDGHDRGAKIIVRALRDAGMEVVYTGIRQTPDTIVQTAIQEDVEVIGLSILSGAHTELFSKIVDGLSKNNMDHVVLVAGGIIPQEDHAALADLGIGYVFGPGSNTTDIVNTIKNCVLEKRSLSETR